MKSRWSWLAALAAPTVLMTAAAASSPGGYHLIRKFVLGGEGGWDYLAVGKD